MPYKIRIGKPKHRDPEVFKAGVRRPRRRRNEGRRHEEKVRLRSNDGNALKRKAVEKGLLMPEAAAGMSEEAAFQLIFLPGLTTAAKVTDVSGRGVGMDVVRANVRNLQGTIEIRPKLARALRC